MKLVSIDNLLRFLNTLPYFEEKDLYVEGTRVRDFKGIAYKGTNKIVAIVSNKYNLVQHSQVFEFAINTIVSQYGENSVCGWVEHYKTKAYLFLTFKEVNVENDSKYKVGLLITNSVDSTLSIWTTLFNYREVCSNGLIEKHNIITIQNKHLGGTNLWSRLSSRFGIVLQQFDILVKKHFDTLEELKNIVAPSIDVLEILRRNYKISRKAYYTIMRKVKSVDTLFNIYQAITNYYSNNKSRNITSRVEMLRKAQDLIYNYAKSKALSGGING
jgi:hypothetical protein